MSGIQAVILAAGEGSRLRPLTKNRPKAMIPVGNRPILGYVMDALMANGIRDIIVVLGYRKEQVMAYLNQRNDPVTVVVQEKQLGTAHALTCAQKHLTGDFLVLPGDNWIDATSVARIASTENAMLVKEHSHPTNFGVVSIKDGMITHIFEKPAVAPTHTVSTGVLSLTQDFFKHVTTPEIPDALMHMISDGISLRAVVAEQWHDALVPWDLLHMNALLLQGISSRREGTIHRGAILQGHVQVGKGTVIHPHTAIYGPCIIGEDCEIGPNVTIMPHTSIGSRATIAPHTHVANALFLDDVAIGSQCTIRDAVLGEGCTIGDHVTTVSRATLHTIGNEVWTASFGGILGDRVTAAPFTVFQTCIVGNEVTIEEGRVLRGVLPDGSVVR